MPSPEKPKPTCEKTPERPGSERRFVNLLVDDKVRARAHMIRRWRKERNITKPMLAVRERDTGLLVHLLIWVEECSPFGYNGACKVCDACLERQGFDKTKFKITKVSDDDLYKVCAEPGPWMSNDIPERAPETKKTSKQKLDLEPAPLEGKKVLNWESKFESTSEEEVELEVSPPLQDFMLKQKYSMHSNIPGPESEFAPEWLSGMIAIARQVSEDLNEHVFDVFTGTGQALERARREQERFASERPQVIYTASERLQVIYAAVQPASEVVQVPYSLSADQNTQLDPRFCPSQGIRRMTGTLVPEIYQIVDDRFVWCGANKWPQESYQETSPSWSKSAADLAGVDCWGFWLPRQGMAGTHVGTAKVRDEAGVQHTAYLLSFNGDQYFAMFAPRGLQRVLREDEQRHVWLRAEDSRREFCQHCGRDREFRTENTLCDATFQRPILMR